MAADARFRPQQGVAPTQQAIVGAPPEVNFSKVNVKEIAFGMLPEDERRRAEARDIPAIERCVVLHNQVSLYMDAAVEERLKVDNAIDDMRGRFRDAQSWIREGALPEGVSKYDARSALLKIMDGAQGNEAFRGSLGQPLPDALVSIGGAKTSLHGLLEETAAKMRAEEQAVYAKHGIGPGSTAFVYRTYGNPNSHGAMEHDLREIIREEARRNPTPGGTSLMLASGPIIYAWVGDGKTEVWKDVITHEFGHIIGASHAPLETFKAEVFAEGVNLLRKWEEGISRGELIAHYKERKESMEKRGEYMYEELHGTMLKIVERSETAGQAQELLRLCVFGEDAAGRIIGEANHASMINDFLDGKTSLALPVRGPEPLAEYEEKLRPEESHWKKSIEWIRELRERLGGREA